MKPPVEHIRVSQRGREILIKLKRKTGIEHWNTLCRWALCRSLAMPTPPVSGKRTPDSNIEMTWRTFAGSSDLILQALLQVRAKRDRIRVEEKEAMAEYFRAHLERGIAAMQNTASLLELIRVPAAAQSEEQA